MAEQAIERCCRTVVAARDATPLEGHAAAENALVPQLDVNKPDRVAAAIAAASRTPMHKRCWPMPGDLDHAFSC